jgi:hypothetical protein
MQMARAKGQSDETRIVSDLVRGAPRTFVEFGFHPIEFNCAAIARDPQWRGLLIDGNARQVADARAILPDRIEIEQKFLTLDNIDFIKFRFGQIGVLSIDVDGNDYWFLDRLIDANPSVICIEYNSSFGLEPVTVPYDAAFDRNKKHARGWYHGASLTALAKLSASRGYGLAAISSAGVNAFFTKDGRIDPEKAWRPNAFRERFSGVGHEQQWASIRSMPLVVI